MKAWLRIPAQPLDRWRAFQQGLVRIGFKVIEPHRSCDLGPGDVIVTWNVTTRDRDQIEAAAVFGARHIVAENGYLTSAGGTRFIALSRDGHNGSGTWPVGGPERWARMERSLPPLHVSGNLVLVCAQRGIGSEGMAMPRAWPSETARRIEAMGFAAHIRHAPSACFGQPSLDSELAQSRAVAIWTSNVGTLARLAGKNVILCGPHHIVDGCMGRDFEEIAHPKHRDPLPAFQRLAWAQWTVEEIKSGEPFKMLMER